MGRMYKSIIDAISVTSASDLWWMQCSSIAATIIHEVKVSQDAGETSEQLPLMIFRTVTDQSAEGTANTPNPDNYSDTAFNGIMRTDISSPLAAEGPLLWRDSQNVLNGWHYLPTPETRPIISPTTSESGRLAVKLDAAPGSALTFSGYMVLEEIGG